MNYLAETETSHTTSQHPVPLNMPRIIHPNPFPKSSQEFSIIPPVRYFWSQSNVEFSDPNWNFSYITSHHTPRLTGCAANHSSKYFSVSPKSSIKYPVSRIRTAWWPGVSAFSCLCCGADGRNGYRGDWCYRCLVWLSFRRREWTCQIEEIWFLLMNWGIWFDPEDPIPEL